MTSVSIFGTIAEYVGASEAAFKLLLTILAGYPLAAIYHLFITDKYTKVHHLFFTLSGILLYYFNYGFEVYHSFISVLFTYIWSHLMYNHSKLLVIGNFVFQMAYLLIGYYFTASDSYDIKWTMPQCVLTLRLIGFVYDLSDGKLSNDKLSKDQKETVLSEIPSLLELFGFVYFPASFIIGPQYPFRRYKKFVTKEFVKYKYSTWNGLKRFSIGIMYLLIRQIGSSYIPDDYLLSDEYRNYSFIKKLIVLAIWGRLTLYKYISCWLLAEGALICFGLTFAGLKENGEEDWSGCTNVNLLIFEKATKLSDYVPSFNVNTNHWVSMYVFKRLKFLGNRNVSHAAALLFLAVWHGFHSGYYISFMLEFFFVIFERDLGGVYNKYTTNYQNILESNYLQALINILRYTYTLIFIGWCLIPFVYFDYRNWLTLFSMHHYFGFIFLCTWYIMRFFI